MKRNQVAVLVVVTAFITGSLGLLGQRFGDTVTAIDAWLKEAAYQLWNEPIDPEWVVYELAEAALPITVIAAGGLVLVLIILVLRGLRKVQADHLPGARRRRRTQKVARGDPTEAQSRPKGAI